MPIVLARSLVRLLFYFRLTRIAGFIAKHYRINDLDILPAYRSEARFVNDGSQISQLLYFLGTSGYEDYELDIWMHLCKNAKSICEIGGNIGYFERLPKYSQQFRTTVITNARSSVPSSEIHAPKVAASLASSGPSVDNRSPAEHWSASASLSSVGRDGKCAPRSMREMVSASTPTRSATISCVHPSCLRRFDRLPPNRFARRAESFFFTAIVLSFQSTRMTVTGLSKQGYLCCFNYLHPC